MNKLSLLASDIADRVILGHCEHEAKIAVGEALFNALGFYQVNKRRRPRKPNFRQRDRFLAPYERRFETMLKGVWNEERRIVLANMKRSPIPVKGIIRKDSSFIDSWMYPRQPFIKQLVAKGKRELGGLLSASIQSAIAEYSLDVSFSVVNEKAMEWLGSYVPKLSVNLEAVNTDDLRRALTEGMDAGEGMAKLRDRVNGIFDSYDRDRAEMIARTESIRASNEGNLAVYREAGFEKKIWFANPDACEKICAPIDGQIRGVDEAFDYDDGGYSDGQGPPAHPNCRCAVSPWMDEWEG